MDLRLQDKVIIVTGGARGIGEAIVHQLMGEGALPVVFDRIPGKGFALTVELTDETAVAKAVRTVHGHFGRIDGLVNSVGSDDAVGLGTRDYDALLPSFDENVGHYYAVAQALLSHLKASKGSIVNIVSKVCETGPRGAAGYAASSEIRAASTEQWAEELNAYGIRVNGVVVSEYQTPQYEAWVDRARDPERLWTRIKRLISLGSRLTKAEEIAATVAFLLSRQSRSINGKLLQVDGGYVHLDRGVGVN